MFSASFSSPSAYASIVIVDENVSPNTLGSSSNVRTKRNRPARAIVLNDQPQELEDYFKLTDEEGEDAKRKQKSKVIVSQVIEDDVGEEKRGEKEKKSDSGVLETADESSSSSSSSVSSELFLHLSE
jgi:hypothetical protein